MTAIFKKEIKTFFSQATGYIVIGIFVIINGLFLWVLPGAYNIPENGYASVDGLFELSPWFFMLLCPAITMSMFAEEKKTGTWQLLLSKPISKWNIVSGKFFAGMVLVILSLLPAIIYYFSVSYLAEPEGNIDSGAFWGSFIGLIFLSAIFTSVGIFSSSISESQIVAFIIAFIISFFLFYGFELISSLLSSGNSIVFIDNLGVHFHYKSVSRGVIDSFDIFYFISVSFLFLVLTEWRISKI